MIAAAMIHLLTSRRLVSCQGSAAPPVAVTAHQFEASPRPTGSPRSRTAAGAGPTIIGQCAVSHPSDTRARGTQTLQVSAYASKTNTVPG
jgi:hypothetical protein